MCILATLQCDYQPDCPEGEDEDDCGEQRVAVETCSTNATIILSAVYNVLQ